MMMKVLLPEDFINDRPTYLYNLTNFSLARNCKDFPSPFGNI